MLASMRVDPLALGPCNAPTHFTVSVGRPVPTSDFRCPAGSRPRFNGTAPAMVYGFAGAGKAAELAISHFPPCLTKVLM